MATARKDQIGAAFAAAAGRYEDGAYVQRRVARRLAERAARESLPERAHILEIGCGTGLLTREIRQRWSDAVLIATDLAPEMVAATAAQGIATRLMVMDGEAPALGGERFDLILSSLTFQWFEDLPGALARLHALLRPGGSLCFATMGVGSFIDWRKAHEGEGVASGLPDYPTLADLRTMLGGFAQSWAEDETIPLPERGGRGLVRHFRAIGAQVPRPDYRPLAPAAMRRVIAHFDSGGGSSSYHVLYGGMRRD